MKLPSIKNRLTKEDLGDYRISPGKEKTLNHLIYAVSSFIESEVVAKGLDPMDGVLVISKCQHNMMGEFQKQLRGY